MNTHVHTHTHVINQDGSQVICPVFLKIKKLEELNSYHCHHFLLRKHHRFMIRRFSPYIRYIFLYLILSITFSYHFRLFLKNPVSPCYPLITSRYYRLCLFLLSLLHCLSLLVIIWLVSMDLISLILCYKLVLSTSVGS